MDPEVHRRLKLSVRSPDVRKGGCSPAGLFLDRFAVTCKIQYQTPMLCRWPVRLTQPHSKFRAEITGAELLLRARFFCVVPGLASWSHLRAFFISSTRPAWRFHVPRIWECSINVCLFPVKRKTQNVVDVFVPRLFVVVPFLNNLFSFNRFSALPSRVKIVASNPT